MGTDGYLIYRHKGLYFSDYSRSDSYPSGLGLDVVRRIPRGVSKRRFEEWVRWYREYLDPGYEHSGPFTVQDRPLQIDSAEWMYQIDFDNLVFHINQIPMFRLENRPKKDVFLESIPYSHFSYDHFGHRALHEHTPVELRFNLRAPPPSPPPESSAAYKSCPNRSSTSSIHELLGTPMALSSIERARKALVGVLITRFMIERTTGYYLRILEQVADRSSLPNSMLNLALSLVNFAVGIPNPSLPYNPSGITWDFIWIRKDVCLRITTHLDDEENLQASIGELIHHINETSTEGTFYGIACSIFHCAIVRLDKDERGTSIAHTPALQFMPSFYAREISTPGIEALSRLGCQASGVEFLNALAERYHLPRLTHGSSESVASRVPVEIWRIVGDFITEPIDLVNLAYISPQALSAAADLARCPWVLKYRLVDTVGSISPIPETTEDTNEEEIRRYYFQLGRAKFTAIKGGRRVTVELCQGPRRKTGKTVKVENYLDYRIIDVREPYVLELDDDDVI